MDRGRLRADGDSDEIAVPGGELLELREQLLALCTARGALDALLGVARRQVELGDPALLDLARLGAACLRVRDDRRRGVGRVEALVEVRRARLLEQRLAPLACEAGSSTRSSRSSRPAATRASAARSSSASCGARASTSSRIARSESRRNGTSWQRERIVSGIGPRSSAIRTITAYDGGSSRSLSSASAASSFSRCARWIR